MSGVMRKNRLSSGVRATDHPAVMFTHQAAETARRLSSFFTIMHSILTTEEEEIQGMSQSVHVLLWCCPHFDKKALNAQECSGSAHFTSVGSFKG